MVKIGIKYKETCYIITFMYIMQTSFPSRTPSMGNMTKGNNDVTARGVTSLTQYTAIMQMAYAHRICWKKFFGKVRKTLLIFLEKFK